MSWGHGHDDHGDSKGSSGGGIDIGVMSMIGGFFWVASGSGAMKMYKEGGWGGGHDDHGHH
jgi:hypothetical protein